MKPLCLTLLLTVLCAPLASGKVVLDQEYLVVPNGFSTNYTLDYPGDYMQQTFTLRNRGILTGVGVQVTVTPWFYATSWPPPTDDLHLRITRTDEDGFGIPTEVLATATIKPEDLPVGHDPGPIVDVDLSDWQVEVQEGEKLSILLSSDQTWYSGPLGGTNYTWHRQFFNPHPGGEYSTYSPQLYGPTPLRDIRRNTDEPTVDAGFRVYVEVPEPSALVLLLSCCGLVLYATKRARSRKSSLLRWGTPLMKPLCLTLLLTVLCAPLASGKVVLDQEYLVVQNSFNSNYYLDYPGDYMQQTFTVRNTGTLAGVGVQVSLLGWLYSPSSLPPIDDLHVRITRTDEDGFGIPTEVLATATLRPADLPVGFDPGPITDVDLSEWQVAVQEGENLAILLSSDETDNSGPRGGTEYLWQLQQFNPHPGGEFSIYSPQLYGPTPLRDLRRYTDNPTFDAGFRVYVDVPEPSTWVLLLSCGTLAVWWRSCPGASRATVAGKGA